MGALPLPSDFKKAVDKVAWAWYNGVAVVVRGRNHCRDRELFGVRVAPTFALNGFFK